MSALECNIALETAILAHLQRDNRNSYLPSTLASYSFGLEKVPRDRRGESSHHRLWQNFSPLYGLQPNQPCPVSHLELCPALPTQPSIEAAAEREDPVERAEEVEPYDDPELQEASSSDRLRWSCRIFSTTCWVVVWRICSP